MTSRFETTGGGLQWYVRSLAMKASIDDSWADHVPQTVSLERTANLPRNEQAALSVSFEARRVSFDSFGEKALRTFFMIRAIESQDQLVEEELPLHVRANLARTEPIRGEEGEVVALSWGGDDEVSGQLVEDDQLYDSDARFRFEKMIQFRLNGNAQVLSHEYRERYVSIDDDDEEEVYSGIIYRSSMLEAEEGGVLDLEAWPQLLQPGALPYNDLPPDLIQFDQKITRDAMADDINFYEFVRGYVETGGGVRESRDDQVRAMFAILAFLNLEGSATEVRKHI